MVLPYLVDKTISLSTRSPKTEYKIFEEQRNEANQKWIDHEKILLKISSLISFDLILYATLSANDIIPVCILILIV
jgi:5-bromo-4-chloroindolyl phosphate hydrolysis protein